MILFLQEGIYIDKISIPFVKIEQLYIKWDEKIDLSIKKIEITQKGNSNQNSFNFAELKHLFSKLTLIKSIFEKISINVYIEDKTININYFQNNPFKILFFSNELEIKSFITLNKTFIITTIEEMKYLKRNISLKGNLICDKNLNIYAKLNSNINNEIFLNSSISFEKNKIFYKLSSQEKIYNIKYLVDSLGLSQKIKYWIIDAIDMSSLEIDKIVGWIDINNIKDAYKNIDIKATIYNLNYSYNKNLDSVHSTHTVLLFKKGNLIIRPKEAYSYNQFLDKSWINLDFTKQKFPLSIHLLFDGKLNKDVLKILKNYNINLPFLQKKGVISTDLTIDIYLKDISVNAHGKFYTKKSNFDYIGLNLDIFDAEIILDGYNVTIDNMYATYEDIAKSEVDVVFDAKTASGSVNFRVDEVKLGSISSFNTTPLKVTYNIVPNNSSIDIEMSRWLFQNETININKLNIPFNYKTMSLKIPTTRVTIDKVALLYASGEHSLKTGITLLDIDLLRLSYNNLLLGQYKADMKFIYNQKNRDFNIKLDKKILFKMNSIDFNLQNTDIKIDKDSNLYMKSYATFNNIGISDINLNYNLYKQNGEFSLKNTQIKDNIFSKKEKTDFTIKLKDENLTIDSKDLKLIFTNNANHWLFKINNLKNIEEFSPLLQSVHLNNGNISIKQIKDSKYLDFNSSFTYPYTLLYKNKEALTRYNLYGNANIKDETFNIKLDDLIKINLNKNNLLINMKDLGIDVKEFLNSLENSSSKKKKSNLKIELNAKNCYLFIDKDRKILSDNIKLKYFNKTIISTLKYKSGESIFKLYDNNFELIGNNFNDIFMENIFALSKFRGGNLDFAMVGSLDEYQGILNVNNTTILDYKLLNNILAFVNTIPSLLTFSLPGYNQKGLAVDNAYMNFRAIKDDIKITDINLDSKEIDIRGRGDVNFKTNKIDIELNLITDLASAISKVPVVGYIIFGKDSLSTSLKIDGALNAPVVTSLFAKELIVAPLNIIKRTLLLPVHLFSSDDENSSK